MAIILKFDGFYSFLSNFHPCAVELDGVQYPTVENAFQAAKTLDPKQRELFTICAAGQAKRLGRQVTLRTDWEDVKDGIMSSLLRQKFSKGTPLAEKLLQTGDAYLCEGNTWHDNRWGACQCPRCAQVWHKNELGNMLMRIRAELSI